MTPTRRSVGSEKLWHLELATENPSRPPFFKGRSAMLPELLVATHFPLWKRGTEGDFR